MAWATRAGLLQAQSRLRSGALAASRDFWYASVMNDLLMMWERADERLSQRLFGLADAEYFWAPVPDAWTVYEGTNGWTYHYDFAPPPPAPVTTIAWRLVHIAANNWIYWDYAFGAGVKTFPDLTVPSTADDAIRNWRASAAPVAAWLAGAKPAEFDEPRPNHLGRDLPAGHIVGILLDELIHHGAEIALLRDLHLRAAGVTWQVSDLAKPRRVGELPSWLEPDRTSSTRGGRRALSCETWSKASACPGWQRPGLMRERLACCGRTVPPGRNSSSRFPWRRAEPVLSWVRAGLADGP